jgi:hypothetical protein
MNRILWASSAGAFMLTVLLFLIGFSSQLVGMFAFALFCSMPLFTFTLGGALFTFMSSFRIVPRESNGQPKANKRSQLG